MRLGVIILNWNSAQETVACVQSVELWKSLKPEVIVVDNDSRDVDRKRISKDCPGAHLISNTMNRGYGGGNNNGLKKAMELGCNRVLLLNNDASISEGCVATLLRSLENNPTLGIVGPLLEEFEGEQPNLHCGGRDITRFLNTRLVLAPIEKNKHTLSLIHTDYVPGTVLLMRSDVFMKVGPLDERYFFSGEVADLCERARRKGFACAIERGASATHRPAAKSRGELHLYYSFRNRFLFIRLHRKNRRTLLALWAVRGLLLTGGALLTLRWLRARAIALALIDGLRGRWGDRNEIFGA